MGSIITDRLQDYFNSDFRYALERVEFKLEKELDQDEKNEISVWDAIVWEYSDNGIDLHVTRNVKFIPKSIFSLSVTMIAKLVFKEGMQESFKKKKYDVERSFIENGDFVTNILLNRISLLISQITFTTGINPLVTEPFLLKIDSDVESE